MAEALPIRERWRVVKAAGVKVAGGSPSREEVERAQNILNKQAEARMVSMVSLLPAVTPQGMGYKVEQNHPLTMLDAALSNLRHKLSEINEAEVKFQELIGQKETVQKQITALETARNVISEPETITGL